MRPERPPHGLTLGARPERPRLECPRPERPPPMHLSRPPGPELPPFGQAE